MFQFLKWFSAKLTVMDEELKLRFVDRSGIVTGFWVFWSKTFTSWPSRPSLHNITLDILIQRLFDFNCMEMTKWCRYFGTNLVLSLVDKQGRRKHSPSSCNDCIRNMAYFIKFSNGVEMYKFSEGRIILTGRTSVLNFVLKFYFFSCKTWLTSFSAFVCIFNQRPLWEKNEAQIITKHRKNKQTRSWKNAAKLAIEFFTIWKELLLIERT